MKSVYVFLILSSFFVLIIIRLLFLEIVKMRKLNNIKKEKKYIALYGDRLLCNFCTHCKTSGQLPFTHSISINIAPETKKPKYCDLIRKPLKKKRFLLCQIKVPAKAMRERRNHGTMFD
ncbi:MAG: hypothetical protein JJE17_12030 [Peptostreptococcaceae bacterium]|nr:hypothetical protein [Peptostreptococcaceae bacterium]